MTERDSPKSGMSEVSITSPYGYPPKPSKPSVKSSTFTPNTPSPMSRMSDLHILLSDYERSFGTMTEAERRDFELRYSKNLLPSQKKPERPPVDDTHNNQGDTHP
jgi:hypothetical protein